MRIINNPLISYYCYDIKATSNDIVDILVYVWSASSGEGVQILRFISSGVEVYGDPHLNAPLPNFFISSGKFLNTNLEILLSGHTYDSPF
jgi:hypothetical protein